MVAMETVSPEKAVQREDFCEKRASAVEIPELAGTVENAARLY
jgi:hypothetical protein